MAPPAQNLAPNLKNWADQYNKTPPASPCRISALSIVDGKVVTLSDREIDISFHKGKNELVFSNQICGERIVQKSILWSQLLEIINKISLATPFAEYRTTKETSLFRHIYLYGERDFIFMDNGKETSKKLGSFPCLKCGVVVPEKLITMDHHHPQNSGETFALLKVFRACWLTEAHPTGSIGKFFFNSATKTSRDLYESILAPEKWPQVEFPYSQPTQALNISASQTLSDLGAILYSLLVHFSDLDRVSKWCMHSFLNLKPLCMYCNSSKSNT
jgi:hypothetical protein